MPTINVSLTEDLEHFVAEQVRVGDGYNNQTEVVRDALRLMRRRTEKLAFLRAEVSRGLDDIEAGRVEILTGDLSIEIADRAKTSSEKRKKPSKR